MQVEHSNRVVWVSPTVAVTASDIEKAQPETTPDGRTRIAVVFTDTGLKKIHDLTTAQLKASSVKFVGGFWLRELAERVVESQFGDAKRSKSIGFSHAHSPIEKPRSILLRFAAVTG